MSKNTGGYVSYDLLNYIDSHFPIPSMIHENDNRTFYVFRRYLVQKAVSVFEVELLSTKTIYLRESCA